MATVFPIAPGLNDIWDKSKKGLTEFLANLFDPNRQTAPPAIPGTEQQPPMGIGGLMSGAIMPDTVQQAYESGMVGPMPLEIAANYRSPEAIQAVRRAMAAENKARGGVKGDYIYSKNPIPQKTIDLLDEADKAKALAYNADVDNFQRNPVLSPDPLDQILRGSWFHGMRPEARQAVRDSLIKNYGDYGNWPGNLNDLARQGVANMELATPNVIGLPGSTHATPSYTRFGEPYGVSISASPSIAKNFSADEYIHRVQPLYGGPPTEAIIPMWRPEGQKVMNEGYNTAFNQFLDTPLKGTPNDLYGGAYNDIKHVFADYLNYIDQYKGVSGIENDFLNTMQTSQPLTAQFNTLYSKALQAQGKRGILYSPQRYSEYEMLMLDPSFVRPLDYRKVGDYTGYRETLNGPISKVGRATPGAWKGYVAAEPEFATGATRLSDVFNQVPWVDRINEENKRRIAELIDPKYREAVINQLFN